MNQHFPISHFCLSRVFKILSELLVPLKIIQACLKTVNHSGQHEYMRLFACHEIHLNALLNSKYLFFNIRSSRFFGFIDDPIQFNLILCPVLVLITGTVTPLL